MTTRDDSIHESGTSRQRVCIVDDDDSFRLSLHRLLRAYGFQTESYRCAGEYLLADHADRPSCILLDMFMPGPSGLDLFKALASRGTSPPVIFVTASHDVAATVQALKAGAAGFLTKPVDCEKLLDTVRSAIALDIHRRAARVENQRLRDRYARLTQYERRVFAGLINGMLNKQLAADLGICERSIKSHRSRLMRKMNVASLADLIRSAKLLDLPEYRGATTLRRAQSERQEAAEQQCDRSRTAELAPITNCPLPSSHAA